MSSYNKNDPETIQSLFESIAQTYDFTNGVLSFQLHKLWNRRLINALTTKSPAQSILDLCCGTGEIAYGYLKKSPHPLSATLVDFCPGMLKCAQEKASKQQKLAHHHLNFIQSDVQDLPLASQTIDHAMVAYGIRNVKNPQQCFEEVYRVLRPSGYFGILELTEPSFPFLRWGHNLYLKTALPIIGKLLTSNKDAYQYLCNSISQFAKPMHLKSILANTGFTHIEIKPLTGGIATLILAKKNQNSGS